MAHEGKKTGLGLPAGIFQSTTPPEPAPTRPVAPPRPAGPGDTEPGDDALDAPDAGRDPRAARPSRKRKTAATAGAEKVEGWKLYLTEDVRFRLRLLAFQRGKKISAVANEILDRNLPRWNLERME